MALELISGDWQLDSRPPFDKVNKEGHSIRFNENCDLISTMLVRAKMLGCTAMKFIGDASENKNPDSLTGKGLARLLRQALDYNWLIDSLAGNHDGSMFHLTSSSLEPLAIMAGDKFRLHHDIKYNETKKELFLPYLHKYKSADIKAGITKVLGKHRPQVAFGHYGVANCIVGPRNLTLPGDLLTADVLHANIIPIWFMGHIHKQQTVQIGDCEIVFVGSPVICDFGEREDPKGFAIYDTESGEYELHKISPTRRWMQIDFIDLKKQAETQTEALWGENDLLRITGTHERNEDKYAVAERALKLLGKRPFLVKNDVELVKTEREIRGEEIATASGFREAAKEFMRVGFKDRDAKLKAAALELVLDRLSDQRKRVFGNFVVPQDISAKSFMTFEDFTYEFSQGVPTLIYGENGIGKTNVLEAILFLLSGQTSKPVDLKALVRQQSNRATVTMTLKVDTEIYRIIKSIALKKDGGAKQDVSLEVLVNGNWEDRSDGKNSDVQDKITELVGAGFLTLKSTNFLFQKDLSPFVMTPPAKRKSVFAELLDFEPISRAHRVLKDLWLATTTALTEKQGTLRGMESLGAEASASLPSLEQALIKAQQAHQVAQGDANTAQKALDTSLSAIQAQKAVLESVLARINGLPNTQAALQAARARLDTVVSQYSALRNTKNASHKAKTAELTQLQAGLPTVEAVVAEDNRLAWLTTTGIPQARAVVDALVQQHAACVAENSVSAADVREAQKTLTGLRGNDIGKCSKCGQPLDTKHLEDEIVKTQAELEAAGAKLAVGSGKQQGFESELVKSRKGLKALEDEQSTTQSAKNFHLNARARVLSLIEELGNMVKEGTEAKAKNAADIAACNADIATCEEFDRAQQEQRKAIDAEYQMQKTVADRLDAEWHRANDVTGAAREASIKWEAEVNAINSRIAEIKRAETAIAETKTAIAQLVSDAATQELACAVLDPKTGLPIYLIDIKLPFLEDRINHYMDCLGSDLGIRMSTNEGDRETLAVLVDNGVQPMLDIASYSGGQHDRIEIALKLALSEMSMQTRGIQLGLLCYDEPGVYFDDAGKAGFIRLLFEKCQTQFPVTLIISHDAMLVDNFDNKLNLARGPEKQTVIV